MRFFVGLLSAVVAVGVACDRSSADRSSAEKAPPSASASPQVCESGGGKTPFDAEILPRVAGDYCIDPHAEARAYGGGAPFSLEDICVQLYNGECDEYRAFGLERVTTVRYADDSGSPAAVMVTLLRFGRRAGAYGFFVKRVLAGDDPAKAAVRPLEAGVAGAMGEGKAYIVRGRHVAELAYTNELESPNQTRASSKKVLPALAREIGEKMPGPKRQLDDVALLPSEHRLPLGAGYAWQTLLGIPASGPAAVGYYREGQGDHAKRWRAIVALRPDEAAARDLEETLSRAGLSKRFKQSRTMRVALRGADEIPQQWFFARRGRAFVGVGDDEFAPEQKLDEHEKTKFLRDLATAVARRQAADRTHQHGAGPEKDPDHDD